MADITGTVPSPAEQKYTPKIYIDLPRKSVGEVQGVEVGDVVKIVIIGKIVSKSESQGENEDKAATVAVESKDVSIRKDASTQFSELFEDD